ncbi:msx2-interacting protein [Aplochiton taeniatus]
MPIEDIDIKKVNGVPQYAFVQYSDIASVCKAIKKMDGEYLGSNRLKLGFGKSMPTTCVWLDGLASNITEQYLTRHFCRYGHVVKVVFDRLKGMALILYNNTDFAQAAVRETKGWKIGGNKIKVDFASQESQMAFYRSMQSSGQDIRDFYEIPTERREERRPPYHEFTAERAYFENVRAPGIYPEDARREFPARSRERFPELEHYQGDHFDPRYHEDPREYREYRDPFEQDIRKYTYIQRERERERERFEADRGRWSPSHARRPITPAASPSPSERAPRETERRVYSQSSERSGSVSSLSPSHFEKPDKALLEHGSKSDRTEKDLQIDRISVTEKNKRAKRKEKGDKDKGEKNKSRKGKAQSPSNPPQTELESSFEGGSGRGKVSEQDGSERPKYKGEIDPLNANQTLTSRNENQKIEGPDLGKSESSDMDGKNRAKKHPKSEMGNDGRDPSVDTDRLAARKRRFGEASGRTIRQKRSRLEDEDGNLLPDIGTGGAYLKEMDCDKQKDSQRRDSRSKNERTVFLGSQSKDGQDPGMRGLVELSDEPVDPLDSNRHSGHTITRSFSREGSIDQDITRDKEDQNVYKYVTQTGESDKNVKDKEELDIDLSQSFRKQMEQNRRLHLQQQESDKPEKSGSPQGIEAEDLEHRSLVHEVGKPPQDVTDHFPSHKLKKLDQFDSDLNSKKERVYRSFRQKSEDPDWHSTASPGLQHFPHHAEEGFIDSSLHREVKDFTKTDDKISPDLELAVKRTHMTQISKPGTPSHGGDEDHPKHWESRIKQDLLPDMNISRSLGKNLHNRKRIEYGLWHDLEPGEVRSDSEEDRENKPHSPIPSTSIPLSERPRGDRFSDPKLATLERNKFYSFALDQTITPDTKALLERAKSLSSSREDNWSFLDYDSHFASLRSRKDTEKIESTPRPTPSWYMKKKKIRSGSEDKLDDRKEEPKPEEHERRELFASRFLHSSIFEQDSRRLQHLERKHEEPEQAQNHQTGPQGTIDGQPDPEPVVLFHSRFLELTRLKKEKDQPLQVPKGVDAIDESKGEKMLLQEQQALQMPRIFDPVLEPEIKPISPAEPHVVSEAPLLTSLVAQFLPKEISPHDERSFVPSPSPESLITESLCKEAITEEIENEQVNMPPITPQIDMPTPDTVCSLVPETNIKMGKAQMSCDEDRSNYIIEDETPQIAEQSCSSDDRTRKGLLSSSEPELDPELTHSELPELQSPTAPSLLEELEISKKETLTSKTLTETEEVKKNELITEQMSGDKEASEKSFSTPQKDKGTKETKSKKGKPSPTQTALLPVLSATNSAACSEKQATRKSERIDKEKLKRGSSPRAESKVASDSKSTGKSPIYGTDSDGVTEQSISVSRARRRNVKSVYATPVDDETAMRPGKEITESPRSARKRGEKDTVQLQNIEESLAPITSRRGRPPKNRRQGEDSSTLKGEKFKIDTKDIDSNESESGERIPKVTKGKHTSNSKGLSGQMPIATLTGPSRKGERTELSDETVPQMDFRDDDSLPFQDSSNSSTEDPPLVVAPKVEEKDEKQQLTGTFQTETGKEKYVSADEKTVGGKPSGKEESAFVGDIHSLDKEKVVKGKTKLTRSPKSPVLKNLKIRLNVTEVKDLLQLGDEEPENTEVTSRKIKPGTPEDQLLELSHCKGGSPIDRDEAESSVDPEDIAKTSLSQELELVQAVENIAKFTDPTLAANPSSSPLLPAEIKGNTQEEKPSNPASETELMAAIDSITAEDVAPMPQDPASSTGVDSEAETQQLVQQNKEVDQTISSPIQEDTPFSTTPKKVAKGRTKTPKRSKSQKSNKKDLKESRALSEHTVTLSESTSLNRQNKSEGPLSSTTTAVITATTWKPDPEPLADKRMDSKLSPVEQPQPLKSVCPPTKNHTCPNPQQPPTECISPSMSPSVGRPSIRPLQPSRVPVSPPDWLNQSKDTGAPSSPVLSATPFENQSLPPDSGSANTDHGSSDLRQILMKHKNVSLPGSSSVPGIQASPSTRDSHLPETVTPSTNVSNKSPLMENRLSAQPIVRSTASLPSPEAKSVITVIASTATSVISRVPPDFEKDKVSMPTVNPCADIPLSKQTYRPSIDDGGSYHGPSVGEEGAGRFMLESSSLSTGSSPGLRVNTSEGVVVLSHSGQKMEGPQRISAKISQIPPATAVDMESQQLVSMPQIKPELYNPSLSGTPKCPPSQTEHGHQAKTQQALSSTKQENTGLEKLDSPYQPGLQGVVVKRIPQGIGNPQTMGYHHPDFTLLMKHSKKGEVADPHSADGVKQSWTSAISPAISPHLPSPSGNHVGFVTGAVGERTTSHLSGVKQEPRSPRKSGHPHSPFTKVSSPIGSSSPKGIPVMLPSGLPAMQQYVSGVHHPEQSVIMPPHSGHGNLGRMSPHRATQTIPMGHLVSGEVRVNTPPLSGMNFGIHGDPLPSPWSGPLQQQPTSPQAVSREMVLKVNPSSIRSHEGEQEDARRFHPTAGRQSASQLKQDNLQSDPRGPLRSGLQLDPYMAQRDMRVLMHPQGERTAPETHGGHIQDSLPPPPTTTSLPLSLSPRAHVLTKSMPEKDATKPLEVKRPHSPLSKDGMMGIRASVPAMASPQRVQLISQGPGGSFSEYSAMYTNPRGIHSQITETSPAGLNQAPLNITPAMVSEHSQLKTDGKISQVGHQPVNMVQLLTKYPIVWQGLLALKNDTAAVQLHFVCGNKALAHRSLPLQEGGALLRIVQRMRLEASQLESVARRMTGDMEFCLLLALPCGRDQEDVLNQTQALKSAFINYLQAKLAAGIINIPNPGSNQPAYVLQIFPPCEFSESHLSQLAPDLLNRISNISPHLMIVITSV